MICLSCDSENYEVVMSESFQCSHCDGYVILEYCLCKECQTMWRAIDGQVDEKNIVSAEEFTNMFDQPGNLIVADPDNMPKMDEEFLRRLEEEVMKHEKKDSVTTMSDLVHKCVSCQAVAYEIHRGGIP